MITERIMESETAELNAAAQKVLDAQITLNRAKQELGGVATDIINGRI